MHHPLRSVPALVALLAAPLAAQWPEDPALNQAVVTAAGDQALPKAAPTADGGSWVAWFDQASGNYDVRLQRFDSQGRALFAPGGMLVSGHPQSSSLVDWDLIAASGDHAVIAFTDTRAGSDLDVVVYRVDRDGRFVWGPDGIAVSNNADFEADPRLAETASGDVVVVWNRYGSPAAVRMQRYSAGGTPQLPAGGVIVAAEAGRSPGFARVVASGDGALVSWVRDISFFTSVKHLRAQRFDAAGAPQWAAAVEVFDAYNLPMAYGPQLLPDGAGGAVLCWHASNPSTQLYDSFVQRVDALGAERFGHNGVVVSTAGGTHQLAPRAAFVPSSQDTFVFWNEKDASQSLSGFHAQRLDAAGARQWGGSGLQLLPVTTTQVQPPSAFASGDGATAVVTWSPTPSFGTDLLQAFRLDPQGAQPWGGARDLCTLPSVKSVRHAVAARPDGEAVVFWEDARGGDDDVYGQNLHADGTRGPRMLLSDADEVGLAAGGVVHLALDAGAAFAGAPYAMLGSHTGTAPGQSAFGVHLPLNDGSYFRLTRFQPGHPAFGGFRGRLDASGRASADLTVAAGSNPALAGLTLHHAFVVLDAALRPVLASEARPLLLLP
jgi:hypothetical protein